MIFLLASIQIQLICYHVCKFVFEFTIDSLKIISELEDTRLGTRVIFQDDEGRFLANLRMLKVNRRQNYVTFLLLIVRWAIPVKIKASKNNPSRMKSIVLKSLLFHKTIESDSSMFILRGVIGRNFIAVVVFLSRAFILYLASRLLFWQGCSIFYGVEKFNDIVQVYIHFLVLRSNTCEAHLT